MGRRAPVATALTLICAVLLHGIPGAGESAFRITRGMDGFAELKWGASVEQAERLYRDLDFEKYEVPNPREEPLKVYVRKGESPEIEGVRFDSVQFLFREGRFHELRATLYSKIMPRTLETRAEAAFDTIGGSLRSRLGAPSGEKVDYVTEFIVVVKEATWVERRFTVTLRYEGADRGGEDLLTLTLRERPGR